MSAAQPVERSSAESLKGTQYDLTLTFRDGDQNGNAFAESSSSSSSSSPLSRGESSPASVRSSISLSSGRSSSPLDVDMQECPQKLLAGTNGHVENTRETSVLAPASAQQQQHDCSESNDNSVSVYLDARENDDDATWNNNENLALVFIQEDTSGDHGDIHGDHYGNQNGSRRRYSDDSPAPLCSSENDDIDDDDGDDDQEDSFLSVSSGDMVMRSNSISLDGSERAVSSISVLADSSTSSSSDQEPLPSHSPLPGKETQDLGSPSLVAPGGPEDPALAEVAGQALAQDVGPAFAVDEGLALAEEPRQEEPVDAAAQMIAVDALKKRQQEEGEVQEGTAKLTSASVTEDVKVEVPTVQEKDPLRVHTSAPAGGVASVAADRKAKWLPANRGKQASRTTRPLKPANPGKNDVKTFPMPDLKNVKSKIMSRPPSSVTRVARGDLLAQGKNSGPSPASSEKRPPAASPRSAQGKRDRHDGGDARRRSSSCQSRMAAPKPGVPRGTDPNARMAPPSRPRKKASQQLNSIPHNSVVISRGGPEAVGWAEEPVPDGEDRMEKRAEGAGEAAAPELTDGPEPAADPAVKEQSAAPLEDGDQTVSSKLGPKTGLPTAVASATTAAAAAATAGASTATSASGPVPAPASLAAGAAPGTSATSRAKAGVGPSATSGRDARTGVGNVSPPRGRQIQPAGIPKMRLPERSLAASQPAPPAASKASQNPPGAGITRLPSSSKLPIKGLSTSLSSSSLGSAASESNPTTTARGPNSAPGAKATSPDEKPSRSAPSVGPQVPNKPLTTKLVGMRNRTTSIPGKNSITGLKTPALSKQPQSPLQRSASTRLNRASAAATVDKNKPKQAASAPAPAPGSSPAAPPAPVASPRAAGTQASVLPQPPAPAEKPLGIAHYRQQCERKSQCIQQLRKLLLSGNRHLEALALVVQHVFAEREEALKHKRDLAGELSTIRQELAGSVSCCECLEKEKEEAQLTFEETLQKLREENQAELVQLEERLRAFYSAEWDKTHQAYQEEADKCRALMQQQVEDVRSKQEAHRQEQEAIHAQQMETLKQQNEATLQELQKTHEQNMNALDKTLKDSEASLSRQIEELAMENNELKTKLQAEEERRRILSEKSQKDAHTLYLEQELESLKVVLEMKTQQLHQQDKKLMQMDKIVETNAKLEECLNKVQQENEDYRARMDKHQALSRQLSTEQAMLQQTLQKESKVNKRLSMENEELLWKLHNGDLSSPRRLSPTSPFHSPRNSASFPTAPLSPR
ncbi:hypothetical protein AALO_G00007200 [Alosa alosa]|uniref:Microtubule-associated tumor suppressor 1 n=1 Tax=Alosa alosa TaxID=278164 RepID=A0AAV6HFA1_9TELE|nr:microtubule-associated tumor suppressor 1 homolog [Alosa alosa]XP_048100461.1 microtubule-associated tumor suppressor 1 homolog [Alosa alosa]XP_048100469.1 microtubule-associated tumor suppressor 1 homolog [Alosa alosa]XP_048100477.1 microtubule-associated tumor suppressor 1 homolog [Alosa alosa]KAG5285764.1 hypothetical protein AALO_G00007200 [Alosa alosa]